MIRPHNDRILIRIDPEKEKTAGGLYKPQGASDTMMATGEVLAVGPGAYPKVGPKQSRRIPVGVEPGEGVVFIRFIEKTKTNEQLQQHHLGEDKLLIQPNDILLTYNRSDPVEFL